VGPRPSRAPGATARQSADRLSLAARRRVRFAARAARSAARSKAAHPPTADTPTACRPLEAQGCKAGPKEERLIIRDPQAALDRRWRKPQIAAAAILERCPDPFFCGGRF